MELLDAVSSNDTSFSIRQQKNALEKENELQSQQDNKVGWHQRSCKWTDKWDIDHCAIEFLDY